MIKKIGASLVIVCALLIQPAWVIAQELTPKERREQAKTKALEAREDKEERIAAIKQEVEDRKIALKQEVCERREAKLQTALPKLSNGAVTVKGVIDKMYEKVQGFYESGQLTVANYDELVAAIELAKANAEAALETVENYDFQVDCENESVGEQLDAFRSAITDAKEALKEYRKSLVALISSLKSASASQEEDNNEETVIEETNNED